MSSATFPKAFEDRVINDPFLGEELLLALNKETPTSIRYNGSKFTHHFNNSTAIPWSKNGLFLSERPLFTLDPHFHGGTYYPQEAGSQLLDFTLRQLDFPDQPIFLDLCAAPGGKSTLIADFLNGKGLLVANEVIQNRAKILKENLTKWGATNSIVCNNDPKDFKNIPQFFDCIVVDAPCSGEGMFRKDLKAREEWSENNVDLCVGRQRRIVMDVWDSLKPGGYLIYSTCTFNRNENEDNVQWLIEQTEANIIPIQNPFAQLDREGSGFYALPNQIDTEGFYIAVLQKKGDEKQAKLKLGKNNFTELKDVSSLQHFVKNDAVTFVQWSEYAFALPTQFVPKIKQLFSHLRVIKLGTECGELTRKGLLPNEALVFDDQLIQTSTQRFALSKEQALMYLKGETFPLEGKQGYGIMQFEGTNLGWIKHLGNRFNNLYPKEWRIRMRIN